MLGNTSMRILMHAIAVIRPRGGPFDADIDGDVARSILGFLDYLPAPTRLSFPLGLRLLEYGPVLFHEGPRRFSTMDEATASRYLHRWEKAGSAPSMLYQGVRALVLVCFYQHPRILEAMQVDWQGRADERVRYRALVLKGMAATGTAKGVAAAAQADPATTQSDPATAQPHAAAPPSDAPRGRARSRTRAAKRPSTDPGAAEAAGQATAASTAERETPIRPAEESAPLEGAAPTEGTQEGETHE